MLTAPKPMVVMEFDIGSFDRTKYRFQQEINSGLIKYEAYPMPIQVGKFDPKTLEVRPSKIIVGMKELFYKWLSAYLKHLSDPNLASIGIDTATLLYSIICDSYLQEKQEIQFDINGNLLPNERLRVQLTQVEYREPNNRMRGIIYNAKASKKHLVMTHHDRDEYKPTLQRDGTIATTATGKRERAGFATLGDSADVIIHTLWQDAKKDGKGNVTEPGYPSCKVDLAEVKELEGMTFKEPTFDKIEKVIKMLKGIA